MITGDIRLSPNNEFEVKGLTNEDNKAGNKIKVILISKSGTEGIDFKFIRQVHILEPFVSRIFLIFNISFSKMVFLFFIFFISFIKIGINPI